MTKRTETHMKHRLSIQMKSLELRSNRTLRINRNQHVDNELYRDPFCQKENQINNKNRIGKSQETDKGNWQD